MATQIKLRRDTNTNWNTNSTVVLAEGEIGVNLTSGQFKLGDGASTWAQLTYFQPGAPEAASINNFGEGFSLTANNKIVTNKLYSTNLTQPTQHYRLEVDTNGVVILPDQSIINGATLKTIAGNYAGITAGPASPAGKDEDSWVWVDNDGATIATKYSTDNYQWKFNNTGALVYPNNALQRDTGTVTCLGNASTVVYTGSAEHQTTIKLLIQVEGNVGAAVDWDTQSCEMIIAKSWRANVVAASVYAVVHTSVAPLATFTAEWNALTSRVEVLCTTPSANDVYVKTFATEIYTAD
jgi:hypothetical protein